MLALSGLYVEECTSDTRWIHAALDPDSGATRVDKSSTSPTAHVIRMLMIKAPMMFIVAMMILMLILIPMVFRCRLTIIMVMMVVRMSMRK